MKFGWLISFICLILSTSAQDTLPDSIQNKLKQANKIEQIAVLNQYAYDLVDKNNEEALKVSLKTYEMAVEMAVGEEIAKAQRNIGVCYYKIGENKKALEYLKPALVEYEKQENIEEVARIHHHIGGASYFLGDLEAAHSNFFTALKYYIQLGEKSITGDLYSNISSVYLQMHDTAKSMDYALKALEVMRNIESEEGMSSAYHNIANIYFEQEEYLKTIEFNLKSMELDKRIGDQKGVATSLNNIAGVYFKVEDYENAMKYYKKALKVYDSLQDLRNISMVTSNIGFTIECMGKPKEALEYYKKSYEMAKKIDYTAQILFAIESFAVIYDSIGQHKLAYRYLDTLRQLEDSFFNEEKHLQLAELEAKFQNDQKEHQIRLLSKDAKISEEKLKRRNLLILFFGVAVILLVFLSFFIWRSFILKKKSNQMLRTQNWEILEKNEELQQQREEILTQREEIERKSEHLQEAYETIELKNKNITDSIIYAKKIQKALLSNTEKVGLLFKDSFIFHKAKDIVSGDFYWVEKVDDKIFVAVVDCTGHGVPGAFMSIIANTLLNKVIIQDKHSTAASILNALNNELNHVLYRSDKEERIKDGMDLALCIIDQSANTLHYAGAHNPIYLVCETAPEIKENRKKRTKTFTFNSTNKILIECIPDKYPIGKYFADDFTSFSTIDITLNNTCSIYMFSDGYADQFGGEHNRKFMYNRFRELIVKNSSLPCSQQRSELETAFYSWKGEYDQIDDVLIIGLRLQE